MSLPTSRYFYFLLFFILLSSLLHPSIPAFADVQQNTTVSLAIPPRVSDFQFALASTDNATLVHQGTTLSYQIQYGVKQSAGFTSPITLVADFSNDQVSGADLLSYVPESASMGYGSTSPIVDLINKTITWNMPALPLGTVDQTVFFKLQTTNLYTKTDTVPFTIKASMNNIYTSIPMQSITQTYQYYLAPPPPAPTSIITATPVPRPPVKASLPLSPTISLREVSAQSITTAVQTTKPAKITVVYGISPHTLTNIISTNTYSTDQEIALTGLSPATTYYFRVTALYSDGMTITSDIYSATTGQQAPVVDINPLSIVIISANNLLSSPTNKTNSDSNVQLPTIVLPENAPYTFHFQLQNNANINKVQAIVRNRYVLGIATNQPDDANTFTTDLIESQGGIYSGVLQMSSDKGDYQLFIRIYDTKGNITEHLLANLNALDPFTVVDKTTNKPLEDAQVTWYYRNQQSHQYALLPSSLFSIANPDTTNRQGQISAQLPPGEYKAIVRDLGYEQQTVFFTIGAEKTQIYPTVYLIKNSFNPVTTVALGLNTLEDITSATRLYLLTLANSSIFFTFNAYLATSILVVLPFISFLTRIHIPEKFMFSYIKHISKEATLGEKKQKKLIDMTTQEPIAGADIFFIDNKTHQILYHTKTNALGYFNYSLPKEHISIVVMKHGYEPGILTNVHLELTSYILSLAQQQHVSSLLKKAEAFTREIFALLFETLLVLSLAFELALGYTLGFEKTMIFILISCANIVLWILHLIHIRTTQYYK